MHRLDPKNDLVFKLLFTRNPALLCHMLEGFLGRPVLDVEIVDPTIPGELSIERAVVLDVRAVLADGSRSDIEMQMRTPEDLAARLVYYVARDYADQLRRGDGFHQLTPTLGIVWLVEPMDPPLDRLHSVFELRERQTHTRLSDHLAIHVVQLSHLRPSDAIGYHVTVGRWARFFLAGTDADFERLASEDPIMRTAKEALEQLSLDPEVRRRAREREDSIKLYNMSLVASEAKGRAKGRAEGRAEGRVEGRAEGKVDVLLELLQLRFGSLGDTSRARVESATSKQLDAWVERVLTAKTLDDVLGP